MLASEEGRMEEARLLLRVIEAHPYSELAPRQVKSHRRPWLIDILKRFRAQLAGG